MKSRDKRAYRRYMAEHTICEYCGTPGTFGNPIDPPHHIIFKSHGGTDEPHNLITLCRMHHSAAHGLIRGIMAKNFRFELLKAKGKK